MRGEEEVVAVRCYSGHRYAQEPRSFTWRGRAYAVAAVDGVGRVLDAESGEVSVHFLVRTDAGWACRLVYNEDEDVWTIGDVERLARGDGHEIRTIC